MVPYYMLDPVNTESKAGALSFFGDALDQRMSDECKCKMWITSTRC